MYLSFALLQRLCVVLSGCFVKVMSDKRKFFETEILSSVLCKVATTHPPPYYFQCIIVIVSRVGFIVFLNAFVMLPDMLYRGRQV